MTDADFELRPTEERDIEALNALYERVAGRVRTPEQWSWEWRGSPYGAGPSWVIVARESGRIVGHHGLIELPLRARERVLRAARTENTMVDPDFREAFYYPAYEAQLLKQYRARYDVLLTTAGKSVQAAMRRRLGYRAVGRWIDVTIAETLAFRAARDLGRFGAATTGFLGRATLREPPRGLELVETRDVERVARLWSESTSSCAITPQRSTEYLRWRLLEHAWQRFELALIVRDGRDESFLAWREEPGRGASRRVRIEDVFSRNDDESELRAAFEVFAWRMRAEPVRIRLRTIDRDRPLLRAARGIGAKWLEREPEPDEAELFALAPEFGPDAAWDATMLVDEGL